MKKIYTLFCVLLSAVLLCSCGVSDGYGYSGEAGDGKVTEITLWTFPVGNWSNPTSVSSILMGFHNAYPKIHVSVEYLDYNTGDARISEAAQKNELPDLVFEGPERVVANWGTRDMMVDLTELWQSQKAQKVYDNVSKACKAADGKYYEVPICMTAHCMAINYDIFKAADALQYIDEVTHTWTTENFVKAVDAVAEYGKKMDAEYGNTVGEVYCKNQSGDQGTRALVTNLCGGSFTDDGQTKYTVDSKENIEALTLLRSMEGIKFNEEATATDAIDNFCKKDTAMCFCWSASLAVQQIINNPDFDFTVLPMAFPSESGTPQLQGGIWGFGVFDNGSTARENAAKTFIRYITEDEDVYRKAVIVSSYWPVRDILRGGAEINIYENDEIMYEYGIFMRYMGDYYQVMPDWQDARDAWWQMLARIGDGEDISTAIKDFPQKSV